ncbi:CPBP family intramembrane glutamic endopeptidase [uncultured Methanobrevibacter sp.]|uniref:CPBP family intramembrane glutamic endopeptidase n=1 Tax=uncultured Methanobrevibacter sp. TaxID=253161 RepID=UPI0025FF89E5|nr:type II CAAX endopeptidase family protein [uncultured Methanobrevibacter sp.]
MDFLLNNDYDDSQNHSLPFEKDSEKKILSKLGLGYCLLIMLMFFIPTILIILSHTEDMHLILVYNLLAFSFGGFVLYHIVKEVPESESLHDRKLNIPQYLFYLILGYGLMMLGYLLTNIISSFFIPNLTNPLQSFDSSNIIATFLYAAILGPIFEELFFRKFLISRIARYGELFAILASSLLFALYHMNYYQFLGVFFFGVILAFVYLRTNNIIYVITLHQIANFLGLVLPNLIGSDPTLINYFNICDLIIAVLAGLFALYFVFKVKLRDGEVIVSKFEGLKFFFTNPSILIFIFLALLIGYLNLG